MARITDTPLSNVETDPTMLTSDQASIFGSEEIAQETISSVVLQAIGRHCSAEQCGFHLQAQYYDSGEMMAAGMCNHCPSPNAPAFVVRAVLDYANTELDARERRQRALHESPVYFIFPGDSTTERGLLIPIETLDALAGNKQTPYTLVSMLAHDLQRLGTRATLDERHKRYSNTILASTDLQQVVGSRHPWFLRIGHDLEALIRDKDYMRQYLRVSEKGREILRLLDALLRQVDAYGSADELSRADQD